MNRMPAVKSVMTPFPHFIDRDQPAAEAMRMMEELEIHHLPVKSRGQLVSVVSERDIRLASVSGGLDTLRVADVCSPEAYVVDLAEPLDRVLLQMAEKHIHSALVVKEGRLAGIFTTSDACRHFRQFLRSRYGPEGGDEAA